MKVGEREKGVFFIITSAFFFALMGIFVKLSGDLPTMQKSFFRNFVSLIVAIIMILRSGTKIHYTKEQIPVIILRAFFGTAGILCNYYCLDHMIASDATMLNKLSPFFAIIFSFLFLKEKTKIYQFAAVAIAFLGSLFIIKPTFTGMSFVPSLLGVIGGLSAGVAYTAVRKLGQIKTPGMLVVFFFSAFSCLTTLPFVIAQFKPMSLKQVLFLTLTGICAATAQFSITAAYFHAPAREISVFDYSQVVFSAVLGFLICHEIPDVYSFAGYAVIICTAIFIFIKGKHVKI